MAEFFPYDFDYLFYAIWRSFGVDPDVDGVTLTDDDCSSPPTESFASRHSINNIDCVKSTGPYRWWKSVGFRASAVDSGITFGTTSRGGVCVLFKERIPQIAVGRNGHEGLTVTVADTDGLVTALKGPI